MGMKLYDNGILRFGPTPEGHGIGGYGGYGGWSDWMGHFVRQDVALADEHVGGFMCTNQKLT